MTLAEFIQLTAAQPSDKPINLVMADIGVGADREFKVDYVKVEADRIIIGSTEAMC